MIAKTAQEVKKRYEEVLSIHEQQYGKAEIYADLHTVLRKNLARLQGMIVNEP
jgi:serine/threonine-protein kinase HipA